MRVQLNIPGFELHNVLGTIVGTSDDGELFTILTDSNWRIMLSTARFNPI